MTSSLEEAALYLAISYQLGAACLLFGDLSMTLFTLPLIFTLPLYSCCVGIVYITLIPREFNVPGAPVVLVLCFIGAQYLEAHMITSSYRWIASELKEFREAGSKAIGISDQVCGVFYTSLSKKQYTCCLIIML